MRCDYFERDVCRSCALLDRPYSQQVAEKVDHCRRLLADHPAIAWLDPVTGPDAGFRNKAKMVVGGTVEAPTLGILDDDYAGVDLEDCPLYPPSVSEAFGPLKELVTRAGLVPYDVAARRGELKLVQVTTNGVGDGPGELMVRFVLRSTEAVPRLRKHLPWLLERLPSVRVVSANILPEHKAAVEGDVEIALTPQESLPMRVAGVTLHLRPHSFFQTNTAVAEALYEQARAWVDASGARSLWDLYCGVGGFALVCRQSADGTPRDVLGVETSVEAVASARLSAREAGAGAARFVAQDATAFALAAAPDDVPDLVIVNPPRRGIGPDLAGWLERSGVRHVVYSSCNATSLARDLEAMPSLRPARARVLDMFPHTHHYEVVTLLERA